MADGWEYRTRVFDFRQAGLLGKVPSGDFHDDQFERGANHLGWEGWELVSVMDTNQFDGDTKYIVAFFKRPLTPERRAALQQQHGKTRQE